MKNKRFAKYALLFVLTFLISAVNVYRADAVNTYELPASTTQSQTQPVSIPLTLNNLSNAEIRGIDLSICYDPNVLTATGVSLTGTVLENQNYLTAFNTHNPGIIYAVIASSADIYTGTGHLLNLEFTVIGVSGDTTDITISNAEFNNLTTTVTNGSFTVVPCETIFAGSAEIAAHAIDFTYTVSANVSVALTITSSDPSLIDNSSISVNGSGSNYSTFVTNANTDQAISVEYTPVANAHGRVTLTVTASANGDVSTQTYAVIVSPPGAGNALTFDGTDDIVEVPASSLYETDYSTFELWVKPQDNVNEASILIGLRTETNNCR
ncbi:MAG: hypothetical protein OMM_12710, partial [Candidatus Magnetoglobus multicellularis str. Araruama]